MHIVPTISPSNDSSINSPPNYFKRKLGIISDLVNKITYSIRYKEIPRNFTISNYLSMKQPLKIQEAEITERPPRFGSKFQKIDTGKLHEIGIGLPEAEKLIDYMYDLISDSQKIFKYLEPLEKLLSKKLQDRGISFSKEDLPPYMISLNGYYMPSLPSTPLKEKKGKIINESIWELEKTYGINEDGVPIFVGFVETNLAEDLIRSGYVFKEDVQISRIALHGKNTHRLFILALLEFLKTTEFSHLTGKEILRFLVDCKLIGINLISNIWDSVFDNISDHKKESSSDPSRHGHSCRSPFIMHQKLLEAERFGLPNLGFCLRDSHWKEVLKMFSRIPKEILVSNPEASVTDVHDALIMSMENTRESTGDLGSATMFSLSEDESAKDPKYLPFNLNYKGTRIKRKANQDNVVHNQDNVVDNQEDFVNKLEAEHEEKN